jgi:HD superfamily phosphodiesterase
MDRTERVRQVVDNILRAQPDEEERRAGFVHLYGVAQACAQLALKRGLDAELGTIAGMLHDLWTYKTGDPTDHGRRGAPLAREVLSSLDCFAEDEMATICQAIARHSQKGEVHGPYDELLKDADALQHYLYNTLLPPHGRESARLSALRVELGIE